VFAALVILAKGGVRENERESRAPPRCVVADVIVGHAANGGRNRKIAAIRRPRSPATLCCSPFGIEAAAAAAATVGANVSRAVALAMAVVVVVAVAREVARVGKREVARAVFVSLARAVFVAVARAVASAVS
jgi:hypothetical protein